MTPALDVSEVGDGAEVARAAGERAPRRGLLVTLTAADGLSGEGEASPLAGYSDETIDSLRLELRQGAPRSGLARFALESALVDLVGKRRSASAAAVLGGATAQRTIETSAVIVDDDPRAAAARAIATGARTLKCKVGRDPVHDAETLVALRRMVGPDVALRADANGRFGVDAARAVLAAVAPAALSFVEEPTAAEGLFALGGSPVPIAIDESLLLPGFEARALAASEISVFVVKPAKLGLFHARELALSAHRAKKQVVVTHMFDGPWALAAAASLALSLPFAPLACGLAPHDGLDAYPRRTIATMGPRWTLVASSRPGLGVGVA